jgi:hypothetical protein
VLRCLPPLFAPSGLFGAALVFVAGGIATIVLLVAAGVCRCLLVDFGLLDAPALQCCIILPFAA